MYHDTLPNEWYFLIEETRNIHTKEWARAGGVEIPKKILGEIAKIFEECIPCMRK